MKWWLTSISFYPSLGLQKTLEIHLYDVIESILLQFIVLPFVFGIKLPSNSNKIDLKSSHYLWLLFSLTNSCENMPILLINIFNKKTPLYKFYRPYSVGINNNILQHNKIIRSIFYFYTSGGLLHYPPNPLNLRIVFL